MDFNLPVADDFEVPVDDLLNMPEIHEVLATEIVGASVNGPSFSVPKSASGCNTEDLGEPKGSVKACSRVGEKCQKQEEKQKKHGSSQTSRSIPDIRVDDVFDEETQEKPRTSPRLSSVALPTGQHVRILNDVEVSGLRQRLSARVATLSHDRHEKEEILQKTSKIQELQAELARLNDLEVQLREYEQQPLESLQEELQIRQQEIADLAKKLQNAAQEELDWVSFGGNRNCATKGKIPVPCILYCKEKSEISSSHSAFHRSLMESTAPRPDFSVEDVLVLPEIQEILESNSTTDGIISAGNVKPNARRVEQAQENEKCKRQGITPSVQGSDPISIVSSLSESTTVTISDPESTPSQSSQHPPEFTATLDDLRCKIPSQIASLRRILVEKEREALQRQQIQQLEAELRHLKQIEAQLAQYEKWSVEVLKKELETLQQEVTDLSQQIESALQDELKWVV